MRTSSLYGAFNARWISPEEVAKTFVPTRQFRKLVQTRHSVLMGPRGCGKTTLLKMLTRGAQEYWERNRTKDEPDLRDSFSKPDFEAVYIPSDIRWSYELQSISKNITDSVICERTQRVLVSISELIELTKVFERLLHDCPDYLHAIPIALMQSWRLTGLVPTFSDIRIWLRKQAVALRGAVVKRSPDELSSCIDAFPREFSAHTLDAIFMACGIFQEVASSHVVPRRWAICFDELEIAPTWLQAELLESMRSTDQEYLLKLTWSPILPYAMMNRQMPQGDYDAIRIWHSHIPDAKSFCQEYAGRLISDRFGTRTISASDLFGRSLFAAEERMGENADVYAQGSDIWHSMVELAKRDDSFRQYLTHQKIDPANPITESEKSKDECLRKIKPIVLLRETFRKANGGRSRKKPALYAGEDAVYAMSDGNPRWLAGILNDLLDAMPSYGSGNEAVPMPPSKQAPVLNSACRRMKSYLSAFPVGRREVEMPSHLPLHLLVDTFGRYFSEQLIGPEFTDDPIGSFEVPGDASSTILQEINRGLLLGGLICVGDSPDDIPQDVVGSRIRLSFMLSPKYRLAFRNFRAVRLETIMNRVSDPRQRSMFNDEERADNVDD